MSLLKSRKTKARQRGLSLSRKEREKTYFFVEVENILLSLICKQSMSVWKGYSSGWHYRYMHTHTHTHTHTPTCFFLFFNFLFCVGAQLINKQCCDEQRRDSAIQIHVSIPPQVPACFFPLCYLFALERHWSL